jgi:hypothetical protein
MKPIHIDIGFRSGTLTVLSVERTPQAHGQVAMCRCDCGNLTAKSASQVLSGRVRSCGRHCPAAYPLAAANRVFRDLQAASKLECDKCATEDKVKFATDRKSATGYKSRCKECMEIHGFPSREVPGRNRKYSERRRIQERIRRGRPVHPDLLAKHGIFLTRRRKPTMPVARGAARDAHDNDCRCHLCRLMLQIEYVDRLKRAAGLGIHAQVWQRAISAESQGITGEILRKSLTD